MRVAEEGFRSADYYGQLGMDAAVSLSNSMSIADIPRIGDRWEQNAPARTHTYTHTCVCL